MITPASNSQCAAPKPQPVVNGEMLILAVECHTATLHPLWSVFSWFFQKNGGPAHLLIFPSPSHHEAMDENQEYQFISGYQKRGLLQPVLPQIFVEPLGIAWHFFKHRFSVGFQCKMYWDTLRVSVLWGQFYLRGASPAVSTEKVLKQKALSQLQLCA